MIHIGNRKQNVLSCNQQTRTSKFLIHVLRRIKRRENRKCSDGTDVRWGWFISSFVVAGASVIGLPCSRVQETHPSAQKGHLPVIITFIINCLCGY